MKKPPFPVERVAYSPREFAAALGHHSSWCYRKLHQRQIRAIVGLGEILIPLTELTRILDGAGPYNPDTATNRRPGRPRKGQKENGKHSGNAADAQPRAADPVRRDSDSSMSVGEK